MNKKTITKLLLLSMVTSAIPSVVNFETNVLAQEENKEDTVKFNYDFDREYSFFSKKENIDDWFNVKKDKDISIEFNNYLEKNGKIYIPQIYIIKVNKSGNRDVKILENNKLSITKEELQDLKEVNIAIQHIEVNTPINITVDENTKSIFEKHGVEINNGSYSINDLNKLLHSILAENLNEKYDGNDDKLPANIKDPNKFIYPTLYFICNGKELKVKNFAFTDIRKNSPALNFIGNMNLLKNLPENAEIKIKFKETERKIIKYSIGENLNKFSDPIFPKKEINELIIEDYSNITDENEIIRFLGFMDFSFETDLERENENTNWVDSKNNYVYFLNRIYFNGKELDYRNKDITGYYKQSREFFGFGLKKKIIEANNKELNFKGDYIKVKNSFKFKVENSSKNLIELNLNDSKVDENKSYGVYSLYRLGFSFPNLLENENPDDKYDLYAIFEDGKKVKIQSAYDSFYAIDFSKYLTPEKENTITIKVEPKYNTDNNSNIIIPTPILETPILTNPEVKKENLNKNVWVKIDNYWYRFDENGNKLSNKWYKENNTWYWLKSDGTMASNEWIKENGIWYWLNSDGSMHSNKWLSYNGSWYWLKSSGAMASNEWIYVNGEWFWANDNGDIAENQWIYVNEKCYYAKSGGYIAINTKLKINGITYRFNRSGELF